MSNIDPKFADMFRRVRLEETYDALSRRADVAYFTVCRAFRDRICNDVDAEKIRSVLGDRFLDGLTIVPSRKKDEAKPTKK